MKQKFKEILDTIISCIIIIAINVLICMLLVFSCFAAFVMILFSWSSDIRKFVAKEYEKFYYTLSKLCSHDEYLDDEDI